MEINSNEIKINAKPFKLTIDNLQTDYTIQNSISDINKKLYDWWKALDKNKMLPNQENFNQMFLGIWEKENPTIKKEGNKMIESINLIDLYEHKKGEKIEKEYHEKIYKIRSQLSLEDKFINIIKKAEEQITELYFSQFSEEQMDAYSKGKFLDQKGFSLITREQIRLTPDGSIYVNELLENDEIHNLYVEMANELNELKKQMKIVKAHIAIAKTKEEVEEILTRYGILKKGKLVID